MRADDRLRVLQVHATDGRGGAAQVAIDLHQSLLYRGMDPYMAVRTKISRDPRIIEIPNDDHRRPVARALIRVAKRLEQSKFRGSWTLNRWMRYAAEPIRFAKTSFGMEDYEFPATWKLLELSSKPDVLHLHNLHENYFDLRALPALTHQVPTVLTMHDAWLLSGHCSHSFECERWQTGCGQCPDLTIYPAIASDATAINWKRKKEIFSKSKLCIVTPCQWLMNRMKDSILAPAATRTEVIPNGIDVSVFHPANREEARQKLNLPRARKILLVCADNFRKSAWKDEQTLKASLQKLDATIQNPPICIAIGQQRPPDHIGRIEVEYIDYQNNKLSLATYYQAADLYLHIAKTDTFPNMILEALGCGTPVVATAVGGIPEQIKSFHDAADGTGFVAPPLDYEQISLAIQTLLEKEELRRQISSNAQVDALKRFSLEREVNDYVRLYEMVIGRSQ